MKQCVILCAGEFTGLIHDNTPNQVLLAADGGVRHLAPLGLTPDGILGDFDSLGYVPEGAQVFPVEKDDTDSMLAIRRGLELGCDRFLLYGAMDGSRPDHTVANYQALHFLAQQGARGYLIGTEQIATVIRNDCLEFPADFSGYLSVFAMGPDARGVSLRNVFYPLENATLHSHLPLGVSNRFIGKPARVEVAQGSLLVLWQRANGLL